MHHRLVRKCKRPSGDGLWGAYEIGRDEYGVWLYTPEGSRYRGTSSDGEVSECFAGQPDAPGLHVIQLVPSGDAWWFGHWKTYQGERNVSIDICTPSVLAGNEWSYDDLELDLHKTPKTAGIYDEDEFDEAVEAGFISDDERASGLRTAADLIDRLGAGDSLLDEAAWFRLSEAIALGLDPIHDLIRQDNRSQSGDRT